MSNNGYIEHGDVMSHVEFSAYKAIGHIKMAAFLFSSITGVSRHKLCHIVREILLYVIIPPLLS